MAEIVVGICLILVFKINKVCVILHFVLYRTKKKNEVDTKLVEKIISICKKALYNTVVTKILNSRRA